MNVYFEILNDGGEPETVATVDMPHVPRKSCSGVGCAQCLVKDGPPAKVCTPGCQHPRCVAYRREQRAKEVDELLAIVLEAITRTPDFAGPIARFV